jgi:NAD(P)-dependent dehydrogenase (short-subunit alcohol dehydrogenase family)
MSPRNPTPLAGRTAVITGAGSGIGRGLAQQLSAHGCPVAIVDANAETLAATAPLLDGPTLVRTLDVRDRGGQLAFAAEVREWSPVPIGAVFNNAGVALTSTVAGASPEDDEWLIAINFDGVVNGVRAFLPILLEQRDGAIVNTSSVFGLLGIPHQSAYCASKFAVRGFTDSLRQELGGTGVRAITVHPGGSRRTLPAAHTCTRTPADSGATRTNSPRSSRRSLGLRPSGRQRSSTEGSTAGRRGSSPVRTRTSSTPWRVSRRRTPTGCSTVSIG